MKGFQLKKGIFAIGSSLNGISNLIEPGQKEGIKVICLINLNPFVPNLAVTKPN
jgi:hypothetical protein